MHCLKAMEAPVLFTTTSSLAAVGQSLSSPVSPGLAEIRQKSSCLTFSFRMLPLVAFQPCKEYRREKGRMVPQKQRHFQKSSKKGGGKFQSKFFLQTLDLETGLFDEIDKKIAT